MKKKQKKWIGWFKPLRGAVKSGPLTFVPIEFSPGRSRKQVVITVPGACGISVQRNRFRRVVRSYLAKKGALESAIWIRLSRDFRLNRKILLGDWKDWLDRGLSKVLPLALLSLYIGMS